MKKNLFWMAAFGAAMVLAGCSGDDEGNDGPDPGPAPVVYKQVKKYTEEKSPVDVFGQTITPKNEYTFTYDADKRITRIDNSNVSQYNSSNAYLELAYSANRIMCSGKSGVGGPSERDERLVTFTLNDAATATKAVYAIADGYSKEETTDIEYDSNGSISKITQHMFETTYADGDYEHPIYVPYDDVYTFVYTNGNLTKMTNECVYLEYKAVYDFTYGTKKVENKASVDFFSYVDIGCNTFAELCLYGINGKRSAQIPVKMTVTEYEDNEPGLPEDTDFAITTDNSGYITQYTDGETDNSNVLMKYKFTY